MPHPALVVSSWRLRPGRRRWRCQPVTGPAGELPLKSARERMDIISAYREVGTYRGAAVACGTTHKTVRRVIARHEGGGARLERVARGHNYDGVAGVVAAPGAGTAGRGSAEPRFAAAPA